MTRTEEGIPSSGAPPTEPMTTRRRPCVALLLDRMNLLAGGFEGELRRALVTASAERDVDVVLVYGRQLAVNDPGDAGHNRIYERLRRDRIDAVVFLTTALSAACGVEAFARYLDRFAGFPRVSLGVALPGIPSVVVDGRAGVTAHSANPPLTTVAQPFLSLVRTALDLALGQLAGAATAELVEIPPQVQLRASCGCGRDAPPAPHARWSAAAHEGLEGWVEAAPADGTHILALQRAISELGRSLPASLTTDLQERWHEAVEHLARAVHASQAQHALELHALMLTLATTGDELAGVLDRSSFAVRAARAMRAFRLRAASVIECGRDDHESGRPLLRLLDGEAVPPPILLAPGDELFPPRSPHETERRITLLFPLTFEERCLGIAAFAYDGQSGGHPLFRDQLAAALRTVTLHEAALEATLARERDRQERAATQQRLDALGVLAGSVAHDLNNVLGPLALWSEMILRDLSQPRSLPEDRAERVRRGAERIQASTLQAAQIAGDLLALGRQGRGARRPVELSTLVRNSFEPELGRIAAVTSARVRVHTDLAPAPLWVAAVESQLTRAVGNLLRNAIEACDASGEVTVTTRRVRLAELRLGYEDIPPGDYAVLTVADDGPGIPAADLPHVFEPFFSRKEMGTESGTGLGLAIVRGVVKDFGGFVDVTSTAGRGTRFDLYLPVTDVAIASSDSHPSHHDH